MLVAVVRAACAQPLPIQDSIRQTDSHRALLMADADSLSELLRVPSVDTIRIDLMLQHAQIWHALSLDSAHAILLKSRALSRKAGYIKGEVKTLSQIGAYYQEKHDYPRALELYKEALVTAERNALHREVLENYRRMLNLYFYLGNFAEAMKLSAKGLALGEKRNDTQLQAYYVNLIGFIYLRQHDAAQSEKHYRSYLALARRLGDSLLIADAFSNLADVYSLKEDPSQALAYLEQSLSIYIRSYARKELQKGDRLGYTYFKIGCVYKSQQRYDQALKNCLVAIDYTRRTPSNKYDIASYYIYAGDIYKELRDFPKAIELLHSGLSLSKEIRHRENIRDAYNFIAQTYAMMRLYDSAYYFQKLYDQLEDSIVNEKSRLEIEQVMAAYSLEKKDAEIAGLMHQKRLSEAQTGRDRLLRNTAVIIMLFSLVLVYLLYNRYHLKQKNKFQLEMNRQQNEMFHAIAAVQEQERKRIAQDIHDTLGSILSTAKLRLSGMEEFSGAMHPQEKDHYHNVISLLDEAVTELRNISQNIMPATLSRLGLVAALQNLFDKISSYSGIKIHYAVHGMTGRLDESVEIIIYRVILEGVTNVVKHARAENVTIQLIQYADYINVTVEDDGQGFDVQQVRKTKPGAGLDNIISRIGYLKGKIEIDSTPGQGTSVVMDFPLIPGR